ncbi:phosphoribosylanthranilate isomerase [Brevibacterium sp. HMSC063G07]|uniref:phosphoribosylanthranilate isomerase n=1 Tax=Brevibacterium sp. HMSC063G07 TaxID=1739261 RepID=UPI0008A5C2CD|nr:phosphoribosylanthranilate isomerase [Brevibacterium sp. HMSC063G07]OFL65279.1 hypothetical protein HMPREF2757_05230 [Brevibacterium sp. HMSC063G07]
MTDSLFVKICGVRTREDVRAAVEAGADAMGIMHYAPSPRHVDEDTAKQIVTWIHEAGSALAVLVVFDMDAADAASMAQRIGADALQLHGHYEHSDFTAARAAAPGLKLWRAVSLAHDPEARAGAYGDDLLLLDAPAPGAGQRWDQTQLHERDRGPFVLAGGLTPDNVAQAAASSGAIGVDVSSGVESSRGVKDPELIRAFIEKARTVRKQAAPRQS